MKLLLMMIFVFMSFTAKAEFLAEICDRDSKIIFESDNYGTLTVSRYSPYGQLNTLDSKIIDVAQIDDRTFNELRSIVNDVHYGNYYKTKTTTFVITSSDDGIQYVFVKDARMGIDDFQLTGSSKNCRLSSNPFALKFDAYDIPMKTLVMLDRTFQFTKSEDSAGGSESLIFKEGNSKLQYCKFAKIEIPAKPLNGGQIFEINSIERNFYRADANTRFVEIILKSESHGSIKCLSQENVLKFTIGDLFDALKPKGVILQLADDYLAGDLVTENLKPTSLIKPISPIVIEQGTQQAQLGGAYGKLEACTYSTPEVVTERTVVTSTLYIESIEDYIDSYPRDDGEFPLYSGVNMKFTNGHYLNCYSVDHNTYKLTIHEFLRATNADKVNVRVQF